MTLLIDKHCQEKTQSEAPLNAEDCNKYLKQLNADWSITADNNSINRDIKFKNFYRTMAFVNTLAYIAHQENHHPDFSVSYNRCVITFSTHSVGGLSENDFICAAKIDQLV